MAVAIMAADITAASRAIAPCRAAPMIAVTIVAGTMTGFETGGAGKAGVDIAALCAGLALGTPWGNHAVVSDDAVVPAEDTGGLGGSVCGNRGGAARENDSLTETARHSSGYVSEAAVYALQYCWHDG